MKMLLVQLILPYGYMCTCVPTSSSIHYAQSQRQVASVPQHVDAHCLCDCHNSDRQQQDSLHVDKGSGSRPDIGFAFGGVDVSDDVLELVQGEAPENPFLLQAGLARGQSTTPPQRLL